MEGRVPPFRLRVGKKHSPSPWAFGFIFLFFTGMLLILFLRSPLSEIKEIQISGNQLLSEREILRNTRLMKGVSYFHVNAEALEHALETLPEIKEAHVRKVFPNKVYIQVKEEASIAFFRTSAGTVYPVLADGSVLTHRPVSLWREDRPVFEGWTASSPAFKLAAQKLAMLSTGIRREIRVLKPVADHEDQVQMLTRRHHLVFVRAADLHKKMSYYPSFKDHPRGTLYLLQSIWFSPETNQNSS
ncbi:cell division protein FtsQ/DivIB [Lihuaxuella thermophila]|uniref:Cell division septal protein FtsQ n=1 Tax=Lihuaxuella thermophila TaxID=1173111 RepID=A0A1H8DN31_9BACL|nr:FtsQ-type POTRA domain-containing protein [Lihuaxuella thermophila]SEN08660.1 Cell division septal protein FtsQ [Lihuaxuella thermophila]